jgi:hypothetical protein
LKRSLTILAVCCVVTHLSYAKSQRDTVRAGVYLRSLYNFNSSDFSYDVDLWMWFNYKNPALHPLRTIEVANAKRYEFADTSVENRVEGLWASQNCKATINQNWDLQNYPFDHQKLEIELEETESDIRRVSLIADEPKFEYNDNIDIKGWKIDSSRIWNGVSHYKSDFGDPTLHGESDYSKVHYTIYLARKSWALFFKLFTGCYVAFLVSFLAFFVKPIHVDPRFGLSIGGLFAAVGNKYVVDSNIPSSISFTLVDKIHDITFIFILATILMSIISLKFYDKEQRHWRSMVIDRRSSMALFWSYVAINLSMILNAVYQ